MSSKITTYDVVILGGGPAGLSMAISILQKSQLNVLVVDGQNCGEQRIGESSPPDILLLLKQLNLTKEFYASDHEPSPGYASVWGNSVVGYNDFIVNPMGPSWRLNRKKFDEMLATQAQNLGSKIQWSTRFIATKKLQHNNNYVLSLRNRAKNCEYDVQARFVVDATGVSARFAKAIGIKKSIQDQMFATARFADIVKGHVSKQVLIESVPQGWWYSALLPDNRLVTMMISEKKQLSVLRELQHKGFQKQLLKTSFLSKRLEKISLKNEQFMTCPIYSGILPVIEGINWIAVGDAASSYDPVAAHGIYKGIKDGINASHKIIDFFNQNQKSYEFSKHIKNNYNTYQKNRAQTYAREKRWPQSQFWLNRMAC